MISLRFLIPTMRVRASALCALLVVSFFAVILPQEAGAIPAFARKFDLTCTSCHTKPPRLNAFGEAFHMAGFQIPTTKEGERKKKRMVGRVNMEENILNILAMRVNGNFIQSFQGGDPEELDFAFPLESELYLGGTITDDISYFIELELETREIEGVQGGLYETKSRFGIGPEFFLMIDLAGLKRSLSKSGARGGARKMPASKMGAMDMGDMDMDAMKMGPMVMGPMVMVGKVDPSTNFSYPTNRQLILNVPGRVDNSGTIKRFTMAPMAFASKFFGVTTTGGNSVEVTRSVLYNTRGNYAIDFHMMVGSWLLETGIMQGIGEGTQDSGRKKDPYLMLRYDFMRSGGVSGSVSALAYRGMDTASVGTDTVDWVRYGVAGNVKYKFIDLYGALIWDEIKGLSSAAAPLFDERAMGATVEGDYLASDHLVLSARYDYMEAGGYKTASEDGQVASLQARYYVRDNFSFYLRDSYNLKGQSTNPLNNYTNMVALGADFDF